MDKIAYIIENCSIGVSAACFDTNFERIDKAEKGCSSVAGTSADSQIKGSFCPKYSGLYKMLPSGVIVNAQWMHKLVFHGSEYPLNVNITKRLKAGFCYSYHLINADVTQTSVSFVIFFQNRRYIIDKTESLTCKFDGYIGNYFHPSCAVKERGFRFRVCFYVFMSS